MEYVNVFLVVVAAALIPGFLMFLSVKSRRAFWMWSLGGLWTAFTAWMVFAMTDAAGYESLGYFFGLLLINAPAGIGLLTGGLWGRFKREVLDEHAAS